MIKFKISDPPPAPTNVSTSFHGNLLSVNWRIYHTSSNVSLSYNVTLKVSKTQFIEVTNTFNCVFEIDKNTCGPYELDVTVMNVAGTNSTTVNGFIPVIQDIYHSVYIQEDQIFVNAIFQVKLQI